MVRTLHFHCRGMVSLPGWGTNVLRALRHGQKKKKKHTHCPIKHMAEGKRKEGKKKRGEPIEQVIKSAEKTSHVSIRSLNQHSGKKQYFQTF